MRFTTEWGFAIFSKNYFPIYLELRYVEMYIRFMENTKHPRKRGGGMGRHFTDHFPFGHRRGGDHHNHQHHHEGHHHEMHFSGHHGGGRGFGGMGPDGFDLGGRGPGGRGPGGGRRGGRLFDYGELRILVLALLAEQPAHGYELIKGIEERFGGSYSPSPGVIYPTLSWLEDSGYTVVEASEGSRKRHSVTEEGAAFLAANRAAADALLARSSGEMGRPGVPAPVIRAMENLKLAMRLRFREGPIDDAAAQTIAAAIDEAARIVEQSK